MNAGDFEDECDSLKAESTTNELDKPRKRYGGRWGRDMMIRARESILNQVAGIRSTPGINGGLPELDMGTPSDLGARLKQTLDDLKISVMDENGAKIDYAALKNNHAYMAYREECLSALRTFKPDRLPNTIARRAFWINLYNALVLDAIITLGVEHSVTEGRLGMLAFFRRAAYLVDGQRTSLEDIEHGILRANRGNPYLPGEHFSSIDPRLSWSLSLDPRLHFALNCGGRSCPPFRSYSAEKLNDQLDLATRGFIDATIEVYPEKNELSLSQIFKWYGADFGGQDGVVEFLVKYLPDDHRRHHLLEARNNPTFRYTKYDWSLNSN